MRLIKRDIYLNRLIARRHNQRIKIVTGVRRSGKSFISIYDFLLNSNSLEL